MCNTCAPGPDCRSHGRRPRGWWREGPPRGPNAEVTAGVHVAGGVKGRPGAARSNAHSASPGMGRSFPPPGRGMRTGCGLPPTNTSGHARFPAPCKNFRQDSGASATCTHSHHFSLLPLCCCMNSSLLENEALRIITTPVSSSPSRTKRKPFNEVCFLITNARNCSRSSVSAHFPSIFLFQLHRRCPCVLNY